MAAFARHRPFGITLLAGLAGLAALVALWHTLQYLHLLPFTLGPLQFYGFDLLGALLWGGLTAIWGWAALRLWQVELQGLLFATILSGLNLLLAGLSLLGASTLAALLPALLLNGGILLYCLTPGVRRAFAAATAATPAGPDMAPVSPPAPVAAAAPPPVAPAVAPAAPGACGPPPGGPARTAAPGGCGPGAGRRRPELSAHAAEQLDELKAQGILTDAEFEAQKRKILGA